MQIISTDFPELVIIKPQIFKDERGYFYESYNKSKLPDFISKIDFIQDNQSKSSYGTIRGLHYQLAPYAQSKLIRVIEGEILDIAVDLRRNSPTYGKSFEVLLSEENKDQLFIPKGFAHGFSVLSETATVMYKTDSFYNKDSERGINFKDEYLNIDWKIDLNNVKVSTKDKVLPYFKQAESNFNF